MQIADAQCIFLNLEHLHPFIPTVYLVQLFVGRQDPQKT